VQLLQDAAYQGIDAIKFLFKLWHSERRWGAVLLLEQLSEEAVRRLEQMSPDFYNWLDESVLPPEGVSETRLHDYTITCAEVHSSGLLCSP
jgi:hypothetical protein